VSDDRRVLPARGPETGRGGGRHGRRRRRLRARDRGRRPGIRTGSAALVLAALALSGCESTQEESAKLEKTAKHFALARTGLSIAHASTQAQVLSATVVRGKEGAAAAVTVHNSSSHTLSSVPIAITVENARGQTLYQNNAAGLEAGLTQISSLPAHGSVTWVDDQVPSTGAPASVSAVIGEAHVADGPQPQIEVTGSRLTEASTGETSGTVRNRSNMTQQHLVVYVTARRAGRIEAAGRAILAEVAPGAAAPFQAFLVGSAAGASLQAEAPATTFG
jgi:hypothetical protein